MSDRMPCTSSRPSAPRSGTSFSRTWRTWPPVHEPVDVVDRRAAGRAARTRAPRRARPGPPDARATATPCACRAGLDRSGGQAREPLEPRAFELHLEAVVRVHAEREQPLVDGPGGGLVRGAGVGRLARPVGDQPLDGARPPHHRQEQRARGRRRQQQHHRRERQHGEEIGAGRGRHRHGHEPGLPERADGGGRRILRAGGRAAGSACVAAVRSDGDDLGRPRQVGQRARREARRAGARPRPRRALPTPRTPARSGPCRCDPAGRHSA